MEVLVYPQRQIDRFDDLGNNNLRAAAEAIDGRRGFQAARLRELHPAAAVGLRPRIRRGYWRLPMSNTTTDHDTIRKWAESHGGKPAVVRRAHARGDVGIIRIEFPDNPRS